MTGGVCQVSGRGQIGGSSRPPPVIAPPRTSRNTTRHFISGYDSGEVSMIAEGRGVRLAGRWVLTAGEM